MITKKESKSCKCWKLWLKIIVAPIITGLMVSSSWSCFNDIKSSKISLYLPYAYEYKYQGATNDYGNQIRKILKNVPIEMKLDKDNVAILRIGIHNDNIKTLKKVKLYFILPKGIKVIKSDGWSTWEVDREYFFDFAKRNKDINNGMMECSLPLLMKFSENKAYEIYYKISGENIKYKKDSFIVKAISS